jgi:hypothetical protein
MAINYSFSQKNDILIVEASGEDDGLKEVMDYVQAIIREGIRLNCTKIICDERNLVYKLSTSETFDLAKNTAFAAPKISRTAIVTRPEFKEIIEFWETVAQNRGLIIQVFFTIEDALEWQMKK